MPELLLELRSEEIPARMQAGAANLLEQALRGLPQELGFPFPPAVDEVQTFVTPRRLVGVVKNLPANQPDVEEKGKKGPAVGAPTEAIEGFARSVGVNRNHLRIATLKKGDYYVADISRKGLPTAELLAKKLPELLAAFYWPKSMRWSSGDCKWVRPLRSIVCLLDGEAIPVVFGGVGSGAMTWGHPYLAPEPFAVTGFADYKTKLPVVKVMLDPEERRRVIREDAVAAAEAEGLTLAPDAGLVAENAGLVEWPVVLTGAIDEAFLDLPDEVLTSAMRKHQKYFATLDAEGALAPRFVMVADVAAADGGTAIVAGNERVLRARLADAKFFWDRDRKRSLAERTPELAGIVFHAKLGTLDAKADRLQALATEMAGFVTGADRDRVRSAARLCKADFVTEMVGEFPDLQGIMGRYYALNDGEDPVVADAIAEHYAPQGPNDSSPSAPDSVCLALADKIDTLVGFWLVGEKPTGSKDPFALRRAALGVIRLILENELKLPLGAMFTRAIGTYAGQSLAGRDGDAKGVEENTEGDLLAFFADRLKVHLREKGVRHDLIAAVCEQGGEDDLVRLLAKVDALAGFLSSDDGTNLLTAYKRAANILAIEEKKDNASYDGEPDPGRFEQAEETALFDAISATGPAAVSALDAEQFDSAMATLANLREPVDEFFDAVTVNCEDGGLRRNRLLLLSRIRVALDGVADFSKIEG